MPEDTNRVVRHIDVPHDIRHVPKDNDLISQNTGDGVQDNLPGQGHRVSPGPHDIIFKNMVFRGIMILWHQSKGRPEGRPSADR